MNIVFVSHSAFHPSMVVGSHQLSRVYARAGHRVLHLSLPFSLLHLTRLGKPHMLGRMKTAWKGPTPREPNLLEWVPLSLVPWDAAKLLLHRTGANFSLPLVRRISATLRTHGFESIDIALIDEPRMLGIQSILGADRTVYRATDLYAELRGDPLIEEAEKRLIAEVDGVFATSERVAEHLRRIGNGCRVDVFPNGFDAAHFCRPRDPHATLSGVARPRVVYVGAIDHRFDVESVVGLARSRPDLEVLVYGPAIVPLPGSVPNNLKLMGAIEYESLPAVLQHCEVAMLPFRDIAANHGRSPMKYYEYRASGSRIAAFAGESLVRLKDDEGLFLYDEATTDGLAGAVSDALQHCIDTPHFAQPSSEQSQSWESIAQRMLDRVAELPMAS